MRFRKKPVIVLAEQFLPGKPLPFYAEAVVHFDDERFYVVTIHNQRAYLDSGDWVIREPSGLNLAYPCKPDIFATLYEPVEED